MLTEQRYDVILKLVEENKSVSVTQLKEILNTSESTIRRDITALHNLGKLTKVFGGAIALEGIYNAAEPTVAQKVDVNKEEKMVLAKYAADLIKPEDFVYIDAGTTTGYMVDFICEKNARFVTNAVEHARKLAVKGMQVILIGGELRGSTEAVVGSQAVSAIQQYHFTKGFFGTNGISKKAGFTTPDAGEAMVKKAAMEQCKIKYILADHSKFGEISSVTFAPFLSGEIITDYLEESYSEFKNITVVKK